MKLNGNTLKVLFAFVIIIGAIFWAVTSVLPHSYNGANLNFSVGNGAVSVTNPSDTPINVQLIGTGYSAFRMTSTIDEVSGSSVRQGSGTTTTQLFEFALPSGTSEFTIERGKDVQFVADTATNLEATANPMSKDTVRTTLMIAAAVILGALFYASYSTGHRWIGLLRGKEASAHVPATHVIADSKYNEEIRSYGDNRSESTS